MRTATLEIQMLMPSQETMAKESLKLFIQGGYTQESANIVEQFFCYWFRTKTAKWKIETSSNTYGKKSFPLLCKRKPLMLR